MHSGNMIVEHRTASWFLVAMFAVTSTDGATITHNSNSAQENTFLCGSDVTLTCLVTTVPSFTIWRKDGTSLTSCANTGACLPPTFNDYTFTANITSKQFDLNMNPVAFTDAAVYQCDDTSSPASKTISVAIIPTSATVEENAGSISVTTSCIYPQSGIEIRWYYVEDGKTEAVEYTPDAITPVTSASSCTTGACTSGTGVVTVKHTFTYNEPTTGTLMNVKFRAVVSHAAAAAGSDVIQDTTNTYKMSKPITDGGKDRLSTAEIVGIVIGVVALVVGCIVGVVIVLYCMKQLCFAKGRQGRGHTRLSVI